MTAGPDRAKTIINKTADFILLKYLMDSKYIVYRSFISLEVLIKYILFILRQQSLFSNFLCGNTPENWKMLISNFIKLLFDTQPPLAAYFC
jgi:hypothetical protein